MLLPDFSRYSLALVKDDQIIFSTLGSGLHPLIHVIKEFKDSNLTLFDSCIGKHLGAKDARGMSAVDSAILKAHTVQ